MTYLRKFVDNVVTSFANVFKFEADPALSEAENVDRVIAETGLVAACLACVQPIPAADFLILTPLHAKMCLHIGRIKGFELTNERALEIVREVMGTVWLAVASQVLIGSFVKILPVMGSVMTFPLNYAATWAIGKVVDYYFDCLREGIVPSGEAMKALFAEQFKVGRARGEALDKDDIKRRADELRRKVEARDPSLRTETRFEAEAPAAGASPAAASTAGVEAARGKIKIAPREGPARPKTIGGPPPAADAAAEPSSPDAPAPAVPPSPAAPPSGSSLIDQLERLARLHQAGVLDAAEFEQAKRRLLG